MTHLSVQQLSAHLDCALLGASLQAVESHLETCERCRDELAALTLQDQMLTEALRGETDRELFELIGLRVQSVVHPQRARALEKSITELERVRGERRRQAETVARRVAEQRLQAPLDAQPPALPAAPAAHAGPVKPVVHPHPVEPVQPVAHPHPVERAQPVERVKPVGRPHPPEHPHPPESAPPSAPRPAAPQPAAAAEPDAPAIAAGDLRRRALDEAAARVRHQAAARRKAEEEERARAEHPVRVEAQRLAQAAEAALADAETRARDALAAKARAETRAAVAEEARRQALRTAEEAHRLEAKLAGPAEGGTRSTGHQPSLPREAATLSGEEVSAVHDRPLDPEPGEPAPRPAPRRRSAPSARDQAGARRSRSLTLVAAVAILLVTLWFSLGRQWVHIRVDQLPANAVVEPPAFDHANPAPEQPAPLAPVPIAPLAPGPPPPVVNNAPKLHHAAVSEPVRRSEAPPPAVTASGSGQATVVVEKHSATVAETAPGDESPEDLGLLCGTVRDEDHHPIAGARVMMADVGVVVVTDRVGRFCLTAPRGVRTLSVIALGFSTHRETVSVGRRTSELSVTLHGASPSPTPNGR